MPEQLADQQRWLLHRHVQLQFHRLARLVALAAHPHLLQLHFAHEPVLVWPDCLFKPRVPVAHVVVHDAHCRECLQKGRLTRRDTVLQRHRLLVEHAKRDEKHLHQSLVF